MGPSSAPRVFSEVLAVVAADPRQEAILDYLLDLKKLELSVNPVKVHLSAISAFHPNIEGFSILAHPVSRFFMGLGNLYPESGDLTPTWDLNLVLSYFMKHLNLRQPFSTPFIYEDSLFRSHHNAGRVGEICTLMVELPFTRIMFLYTHALNSYLRFSQSSTSTNLFICHWFSQSHRPM